MRTSVLMAVLSAAAAGSGDSAVPPPRHRWSAFTTFPLPVDGGGRHRRTCAWEGLATAGAWGGRARCREVGGGAGGTVAMRSHGDGPAHNKHLSRRRVMQTATSTAAWLLGGRRGGVPAACATEEDDAKEALRQDYDKFSSRYDELDGGVAAGALGLDRERARMIGSASGLVLEVAVGTGLNLPMYKFRQAGGGGQVDKLVAIDLSAGMLSQARAKSANLRLDESQIQFQAMDVEKLEFPDASFDTVVDTFSLCVFQNPVAALREMKRVCKPGGRILLLENSISDNGLLAAYQVASRSCQPHSPPLASSPLLSESRCPPLVVSFSVRVLPTDTSATWLAIVQSLA